MLSEYLRNILEGQRAEVLDVEKLDESCRELGQGLNELKGMVEEFERYSAELSLGNLLADFPDTDNVLCKNLKVLHESYNELFLGMFSKRREGLLVVDMDSREILYCNKKREDETANKSFCNTCKKRLSFRRELLDWMEDEQYHVWEIDDENDRYYRVTSFIIEWKEYHAVAHIVVDVTEEKQTARSLTSKAYHDADTGIKNRLFFEEYMEKLLRERQEATFCYFDLDGLKFVNDTFGHTEGDMYIQHFVELIRRNFRTGDTFARTGGDEFCLVLSGCIKDLMDRKMEEILKEFQMSDNGSYQWFRQVITNKNDLRLFITASSTCVANLVQY